MAVSIDFLIKVAIFIGAFIISALPLHFAILILKGKTTLGLTLIIAFASGVVLSIIHSFFTIWGWLIGFIVLVWIYHEAFRLKWWKAWIVWLVQLIIIILSLIIGSLLGISIELFLSPNFL